MTCETRSVLLILAFTSMVCEPALAQESGRVDAVTPTRASNIIGPGEAAAIVEHYNFTSGVYLQADASMSKGWIGWRATIPARAKLNIVPHKTKVKACTSENVAYSTIDSGVRAIACAYDDDRNGTFDRISVAGGSAGRIEPTPYRRVELKSIVPGTGSKKIIEYTGSKDGALAFSIKEFTENLESPSSSNDISVPIGTTLPVTVRVGGIVLQIDKVGPEGLTYSIKN